MCDVDVSFVKAVNFFRNIGVISILPEQWTNILLTEINTQHTTLRQRQWSVRTKSSCKVYLLQVFVATPACVRVCVALDQLLLCFFSVPHTHRKRKFTHTNPPQSCYQGALPLLKDMRHVTQLQCGCFLKQVYIETTEFRLRNRLACWSEKHIVLCWH